MYFQHAAEIWRDFPDLVPGVLAVDAVRPDVSVDEPVARFGAVAESRLAGASEGELPEIQAWRRAFARMGLKPTQYRCAAEALLRRFRKEGALPRIHPLIDVCNAISLAFAIPVAVFDVARISGGLEVRRAEGGETYLAFSGETEHPDAGEVVFVDEGARAHARRWTNRQSASSAVRASTSSALIVAEALHASARADVEELVSVVRDELTVLGTVPREDTVLSVSSPRFES